MRMPKLASVRGQTLLTDNKPYLYRQAPIDAECLDDEIIGGTVAINQLVENGDFASASNWTPQEASATLSISDGVARVTRTSGTPTASSPALKDTNQPTAIAGHKYLISCDMRQSVNGGIPYFRSNNFNPQYIDQYTLSTNWQTVEFVRSSTGNNPVVFYVGNGNASTYLSTNDWIEYRNYHIHDLTQMFGSTIADYAYTLEQGHAGDGIAWLKSFGFFTADYYPYDAGSLLSVKTSGHETVKGGITHTYPLSDIELRGIPKLTDGQLYFDGDTYASDGTVTRKFGIVDLGTLNWSFFGNTSTRQAWHSSSLTFKGAPDANTAINAFTPSARAVSYNATWVPNTISTNTPTTGTGLIVCVAPNAYADADAFKTAMSGVYMVYELATPTTETTDPFTNPQQAGSTEEYIDARTVPMPVGHSTQYFNMVQKESIPMHMPNNQPIKMHMPKGSE